MAADKPNYDPAFFRHEQDKENIQEIKSAIQRLPEVRRKLFEQHERYTKAIHDLTIAISREKNITKREALVEELGSYQASLEYIEPAYRKQYVALQTTLMNNLIMIQTATHNADERIIKDKNHCADATSTSAASSAMQKR